MALQIRRGERGQGAGIAFKSGEVIFTTDTKDLYIGDGTTLGGVRIAPIKSINGLSGSLSTGALTLNTDNITEGASNKYYNSTTARIDAGAALVGGNTGSVGISFAYRSDSNTITATVTAGGYSLPTAAPTELGGVKISQGGLAIDGAGLLSVVTPVSTGVVGQLTYYTGTNTVGATGSGLTWTPTGVIYPDTGGQADVAGTVVANRIEIPPSASNGMFISTQLDGNASLEVFAISSAHSSATATAVRYIRSRGTIASPTSIQTNDNIIDIQFAAKTGASSAGIAAQITATAVGTVSSGIVPGKLTLSTANSSGALIDSLTVKATDVTFATRALFADGTAADPSIAFTTDGGLDTGFSHPGDGIIVVSTNSVETARFDSGGFRSTGFVKVGQVSGTLPDPAEAGMIVLDGTTFKGYNGSAWVNLN